MSEIYIVYITVAAQSEAETIALAIVEERLAACANIVPGIRSVYRWQGRIEQGEEVLVIAKTRGELFGALRDRVKSLHSCDCPCIVGWPLRAGFAPFLDWVRAETNP